jgi:hypothetical protein
MAVIEKGDRSEWHILKGNSLSLEGVPDEAGQAQGWGEGVNAYHCRKNHPSP